MRMVKFGQSSRLASKAERELDILADFLGQQLEGNRSVQSGLVGSVDRAHASRP